MPLSVTKPPAPSSIRENAPLEPQRRIFLRARPLNIAGSNKGSLCSYRPCGSSSGKAFAARHADAIFTSQGSLAEAVQFARDVKQRAAKYGRHPDEIVIFPGCSPIVGRSPAEAEQKYQEIASLVDIRDALHYLGRYFNDLDFTQFALDAPFPDLFNFGRNGWESARTGSNTWHAQSI
jgi:alkanesulfonate monooxygenase SsuD/methylene tetrahydromethanopterin reductase-like flavin-dependent oxidoreductase (luciferase family)